MNDRWKIAARMDPAEDSVISSPAPKPHQNQHEFTYFAGDGMLVPMTVTSATTPNHCWASQKLTWQGNRKT